MTRSTPDPVFAEAGRAALLAEVRAEQARRERPRRPVVRLREVLIGSAVVAAAAAVLVVVHTAPLPRTEPATPASSAAVAPSATPTPSRTLAPPSPSGSAALIGPSGSKPRTESEIRDWAATLGLSSVMTEQDVLVVRCMAAKGYLYDPVQQRTGDLRAGHSGMSAADESKWDLALDGTAQPGSYTWQTAGCRGQAVHETGQDAAN